MATGGKVKTYSYGSLEEAEQQHAAAVRAVNRLKDQTPTVVTWEAVIERYADHQRDRDKATPAAQQVTVDRFRRFFWPVLEEEAQLDQERAADLYRQLRTRKGARGVPCSVQEHHHCLSRAKALVR